MNIKKNIDWDPLLAGRTEMDKDSLKKSFLKHLTFSISKDAYSASAHDYYMSAALTARDRLVGRWIKTQQLYYQKDAKRVYYLSLEFLIGRTLGNSIINLQMHQAFQQAMEELGISLEDLREVEQDAGLGNGGLGRLAACFLDSLSSLGYPAHGYGIRYEYGIFTQKIENGAQVETADKWLQFGNPWELPRPEILFPIRFHGRVEAKDLGHGKQKFTWVDGHIVYATPYDTPVPGYGNNTVNTLRLWAAKATTDFDLNFFNSGDYVAAVETKNQDENISRVLYPNDNFAKGKELRLKQQYFFVSATLQDIMRRHKIALQIQGKEIHASLKKLPEKVALQLNDTHPVIAIPEMMRLLMDEENFEWEEAWDITTRMFNYTNHTVLPEALERWSVGILEYLLPRHMMIIREINRRFLEEVGKKYPKDHEKQKRMAIIGDGNDPYVHMAHLAIVGCHRVNGVAALHTQILKEKIFADFNEFYPDKFLNVTNGITHRRWLRKCNTGLSELITKTIGDDWIYDLNKLRELEPFADDSLFREKFLVVKRANKIRLAEYIYKNNNKMEVSLDSIFDCQVKRFHEYKRQLLNVLSTIALYNRIRANPSQTFVPRTVIFSGKAAPGYFMAKLIIRLINAVADVVNNDPVIGDKLKVVFLANYSVSLAERIIPAADLSQQISTAGMEASGTGNMKFALNGALTIGTLDGANVEMKQEVGDDNIFIFGLTAEAVAELRKKGYNPHDYYQANAEIRQALDMIQNNHFSAKEHGLFQPIVDSLLKGGDYYLLLADFESYMQSQDRVSQTYLNPDEWYKKAILNVARMGMFSSDRSIRQYAQNIWNIKPVISDSSQDKPVRR
ncbi:MAG: glycogen/starch/alpha-glucan phosphorylase [Verrucomicrobiota bacterium]